MAVTIKNKALHKKVFKRINANYDKAQKLYNKGKMTAGKVFEKRADRLYKNNYYKIFKVTK
jgi:hypothetical protein